VKRQDEAGHKTPIGKRFCFISHRKHKFSQSNSTRIVPYPKNIQGLCKTK